MESKNISRKQFTKRLRGYDQQEVTVFLRNVAEYTSGLEKQIDTLKAELEDTKREVRELRSRDQSFEAALAQAREMSAEIKTNAERESKLIVSEAELQAEKILNQAHTRLAQIHDDIAELKRQRTQFEVRLRSLVEAHLKLMDVELDRDRELSELEDKIKILRGPAK